MNNLHQAIQNVLATQYNLENFAIKDIHILPDGNTIVLFSWEDDFHGKKEEYTSFLELTPELSESNKTLKAFEIDHLEHFSSEENIEFYNCIKYCKWPFKFIEIFQELEC